MSPKHKSVLVPCFSLENIKHFIDAWTESFTEYKGVLVFFDGDKDTRVLDFIDDLPEHLNRSLYAIGERKGSVVMVWKGHIPKRFAEGEDFDIKGDTWSIYKSHLFVEEKPKQRLISAPFVAIDEKVCVVRGDAYMIRNWLSKVGFSFDKEAKAWTQLVAVDNLGRGLFKWKHEDKQTAWDLEDFVDECPCWDPARKLTVAFE